MADIKIENLNYSYPETGKKALENINLTVPQGQFVLIVGGSGSGKSTLIRAMAGLVPDFYGGTYSGKVEIDHEDIGSYERRRLVQKVGMVFQDPESQLVMTDAEQEIAFGLENLELPNNLIKRRIMEVTSALSLSGYKTSFIPELSGGQKQKVALASVLAMHPDILLLDEPTSQLDPIAGEEILTMVRRLNEENGITIILTEQKLERCFHFADRIIAMENGQIVQDSTNVNAIANWSVRENKPFIPPLSRLFANIHYPHIPVTVKEGRELIKNEFLLDERSSQGISECDKAEVDNQVSEDNHIVDIENLWFTYPNGSEILKNISMELAPNSFTVIMGENGCGKTTLLKNINSLLKPGRGHVRILGQDTKKSTVEELSSTVGYLSQDPNDYLFLPTVREEVNFTLNNLGLKDDGIVDEILGKLDIDKFEDSNPRDLSAGERQRVALASVLVTRPKLLLLDEPTRGLDYELKENLGEILLKLKDEGTAILMIAHDVEFAAEYSDDIILMDDGSIVEKGSKYDLLSNSTFYSPQISRLFHNYRDKVITVKQGEDVLSKLEMRKHKRMKEI
ncbi:energy-coupling factor transport system ATP-binding protein [Dethiosulfatibacter aminovorans DSM 17477]|uniref:Energy-coupling factor transport system ATP-binding protein n=1 Tax=Dethiosulfatibacter aminovorans DSM 17477 TaxID=1121476 RepID=A0A1M6BNQ8_9FIRM|nr:ABC transporter ATP-binding protein [Dethiosulfatibacter aminovorans]SHI50297.1 energy-coupling factor transport system ATP-binding protein [Dethiosulfatibacter aminovorans DSM 17477]